MTLQIKLAEALPAQPTPLWTLVKQVGVTHAVTGIPDSPEGPPPWDYLHLLRLKQRFADAGLELSVIESAPASVMEPIKLGLPNRDERIERFCELVDNMGRVGIPVMCHNFMAGFGWLRTSMTTPGRGGALVTGYDHELMRDAPPTEYGTITEDQLWDNMTAFLRKVVPVAEKAGVKLAVHPDDPPLSPIRGIGRILTNPDAFQRVIDIAPSPANGITFCQGNFSAMGADVPAEIRRFGRQGKIFFVHFRDVRGTPERFVETFHDEGQTDMFETMRAYDEVGFDGPMRCDHVPTMVGEGNNAPGYESMGRLFAIGYMKGLMEGVDKAEHREAGNGR
ncbi:MAG TPA: mannonate dehydratase [Thermomicrobiales bacterium]|nr:mannonate dehydratase [Thermomicrobiales bacterium]